MAPAGAVPLSAYPGDRVTISCARCGRRGVYTKRALLARHGDIGLPDLLARIVTGAGCTLRHSMQTPCAALFEELAGRRRGP